MNSNVEEILGELRPVDAERVAEIFPPEFRTRLRNRITTESRVTRRPRRPRGARAIAWSAVAAAAAAIVLVIGTSGPDGRGTPAAAAVRFERVSAGDIVARVVNPYATANDLRAELKQHGYDIALSLVPASPSVVGTVVFVGGDGASGNQIRALQGGHCLTGGGGCPVGLAIPAGFRGEATIVLGRRAREGERYESSASSLAPGEALHCSGLLGARVSAALPILESKHLRVSRWRDHDTNETFTDPPSSAYIWAIDPVADGAVSVATSPKPFDAAHTDIADLGAYEAALDAGC